MKFILVFFIVFPSISLSFSPTPFSYDIKGVEATGDTVVVFGSLGTGMISFDNAESWQKIQPFRGDNIAQIFIEENRMVAFSEFNKISVSIDGGKHWEVKADYKDTINYIMSYNQNYYIRSGYNVIKINNEFEKERTIKLSTSYQDYKYYHNYSHNFYNSNDSQIITIYNDNLVILDSNIVYKLDFDLNIIDSLNVPNNTSKSIFSISNKLLIFTGSVFYETLNFKDLNVFLNVSKPNKNLFGEYGATLRNPRIFNDEFYCLNHTNYDFIGPYYRIYELLDSNNATFLGEIDLNDKYKTNLFFLNDYVINKNKVICVSDDKLLTVYDMKTKENKIVSDLTGINYNRDYPIIYLNDTTLIYQIETVTNVTDEKVPKLLISKDRGKSFNLIKSDSILFNTNYRFKYRTFDAISQTLYYLCINGKEDITIAQTSDYGKSFKMDTVYDINLQGYTIVTNFQKTIDGFIIGMGVSFSKEFSIVYQIDTDYNLVNTIKDTNYTLIKVKAKNRNELVTLNKITFIEDSIVNNYFIQHTTNAGVDWVRLGGNGGTDEKDSLKGFIRVDEFSMKGKDYWLLYSYNNNDSLLTLKTFDLEAYEYKLLYSFKTELFGDNYSKGISFASLSKNDTLYVSINDTIYVMPTLDNQSNWNRIQIPNNGYFGFRYPLNKFGNNFLGFYRDDYFPPSLYWVTFEDDGTTNIVETETQRNYLYTLPPYPLPSQNEVKVQFYWDINLPMTADDITVYDITGRKLITKDKIRLEKQADHYGNLIWDCSSEEPGIYLINIKHGTEERSVKVVVE